MDQIFILLCRKQVCCRDPSCQYPTGYWPDQDILYDTITDHFGSDRYPNSNRNKSYYNHNKSWEVNTSCRDSFHEVADFGHFLCKFCHIELASEAKSGEVWSCGFRIDGEIHSPNNFDSDHTLRLPSSVTGGDECSESVKRAQTHTSCANLVAPHGKLC